MFDTSDLYVDMRKPDSYRDLDIFGVPATAKPNGEAWRIVCRVDESQEAVSVLGFARKRDAECALDALKRNGMVDFVTLKQRPFAERAKIMLESLQW